MLLILPLRVMALLVPPTVTPPPLVAARLPEATDRMTVTGLLPASASLKLIPVMALGMSSVTPMVAGAATIGASLTAVTLTVLVAGVLSSSPSLTTKLTVRLAVLGASLLLLYVTERRAACHWARLALAPVEVSVSTPVLGL